MNLILKFAPWLITAAIGAVGSFLAARTYYVPQIKAAQASLAALKTQVKAEGEAQAARVEYVDREVVKVVEVGRKEDAKRISDLDVRLRIALDELRIERSARAQLKDANSAPAECRNYAADPRQLSVPHAEFLVREAARAESIAVQRDGCIRDYNAVRERINSLNSGVSP